LFSDNEYKNAARRVRKKIAFYFHLVVYAVVNTILITINIVSHDKVWFYYPMLGWLAGLLIHAFFTYSGSYSSFINKMIEKELKTIKRPHNKR